MIVNKAQNKIESERRKLALEMKKKIVDLSLQIVKQILSDTLDINIQKEINKKVINQLVKTSFKEESQSPIN